MKPEEISVVLTEHAAWLNGEPGVRANLARANLARANLARANLVRANLEGAGLRGANLEGANLEGANLEGAGLRGANLEGAGLRGANLEGASLRGANLASANLAGAILADANLEGANLARANLEGANLEGANLRGAILADANLEGANLEGADLKGTCLDPAAPVPAASDSEIIAAGLEPDGPLVYGWRTALSQHCGSTAYAPGSSHVALWFSVDAGSACHPGLYLAGALWLAREYPREPRVRCRCLRSELVCAGDKWRAKRLWIQCADGSWPEVSP